jgi:MFS transporter, UMF1 family
VLGWGYPGTFRAMAIAFLFFAIPSFVLIQEPDIVRTTPPRLGQVISGLLASWKLASEYRGVVRFLVGRFFYTDAINTLVGGFLTIFVQDELGFTVAESTALLGVAIAAAVVGGLGAGQLLRKMAPLPLLRVVMVAWIVALSAGIFANVTGITEIAWAIGPLGGLALGATWASDRVVMYRISPPRHLGEFYGLYATVGRFATIVGPLVWAVIVDAIGLSRNYAMGALACFVAVSLWVLRGVDDTQRVWAADGVTPISENPDGART